MLVDIVVDTNVWVHAGNPESEYFTDAQGFLNALVQASTEICLDNGFSLIEADNRSIIGHEYLTQVRWVLVAYEVLVLLLRRGQFRVISSDVAQDVKTTIDSLVTNAHDRHFLRVSFNSQERELVSHDFDDFDHGTRVQIHSQLGIDVETAGEATEQLLA